MKMKSTGLVIALCAVGLLGTATVQAAVPFCVSIVGQKQGAFAGTASTSGRKTACVSRIEASGFSYGVVSPRDMATGMLTGKRQHKPIRIKKEWGAASPQLFRALEDNELLVSVTLDFFVVEQVTGQMVLDHSIQLTNAFLTSIEHSSEVLTSTEAVSRLPAMETLELSFQKIELIDHKSKATAVSDNSAAN